MINWFLFLKLKTINYQSIANILLDWIILIDYLIFHKIAILL